MQIAEQIFAAGLHVFPCYANKAPAVGKGIDWHIPAQLPPIQNVWPSGVVGLPIPHGSVVIDLDTYKGVTRASVEMALGCVLPWDTAMIQTTGRGGQHYAFAVDWDVKQGSNINGVEGLDTRCAGKGYIATGEGYTPSGLGVYALAFPAALPRLPDICRHALEHVDRHIEPVDLPEGDKDIETMREALKHIDPGCGRSQWVKVGLALRHQFHDDEETGYALFDQWSCGDLWPDGCPANYDGDGMPNQWGSFKAEGGVTIASLYYTAIAAGWQPPSNIDTAAAFGPGAATADVFNEITTRIHESGTDMTQTAAILDEITASGCNMLQRDLLVLALKAALKTEGLMDKKLSNKIDSATRSEPRVAGLYGKNHTENALQFLETRYPNGTLRRSDELWYVYTGKAWAEVLDASMQAILAADMLSSSPMHSTIKGTYSMLADLVHTEQRCGQGLKQGTILFDNGVLDLQSGTLSAHSPAYFTTNILPYSYSNAAVAPRWLAFLQEVFEHDYERIQLLQEWFGYMVSPSYEYQKILLLLGPARSGKGTIGHVLHEVVGSHNFSGGSLLAFSTDAFIDSLRDKTVVFVGDAEKSINRNFIGSVIERLKTISGHDEVIVARKYKSTLSTAVPARITIAANHIPNLFDDSGALANRLMALPFDVSFLGREDPELAEKLLTEIEGIAAWSLEGLARLHSRGRFIVPQATKQEATNIAEAYSPLTTFVEEECMLTGLEGDKIFGVDVYDVYLKWALSAREDRTLSKKVFIGAFTSAVRGQGVKYGPQRIGTDRQRGYIGLKMRQDIAGAFTPSTSTQPVRH